MKSWFSLRGEPVDHTSKSDPTSNQSTLRGRDQTTGQDAEIDLTQYSLCDPDKNYPMEDKSQGWTAKAKKAGEQLFLRWRTHEDTPQPSTSAATPSSVATAPKPPRHTNSSPSLLTAAMKSTTAGIGRMWNNVKYSKRVQRINAEDSYDRDGEIWLLGKQYDGCVKLQRENLAADYSSRIWLTYRIGFPALPGSVNLTSDCGWGCMLRSAQMILAQAILVQRLGRDWRFRGPPEPVGEVEDTWAEEEGDDFFEDDTAVPLWTPDPEHRAIICLFEDSPLPEAPLGLHALLKAHQRDVLWNDKQEDVQKFEGRWFAPSEALLMLRECLRISHSPLTADLLLVYNVDGRIVMSDIERLSSGWTKAVVLAVCLRLGTQNVNRCYYPHFRLLFGMETCLGLIGGKPKHSLYFVGCTGEDLIYLDPHIAHPYAPFKEELAADFDMLPKKQRRKAYKLWNSFRCTALSRTPITEIDPSFAVAFLFRSQDEMVATFESLNLNQVIDVDAGVNGQKRTRDPLFTVFHEQPPAFQGSDMAHDEAEVAKAREHGFELL